MIIGVLKTLTLIVFCGWNLCSRLRPYLLLRKVIYARLYRPVNANATTAKPAAAEMNESQRKIFRWNGPN